VSVCSCVVCTYWHTGPNHATPPNNHTVLCVGAFGFSFVQTITNNLTFHIQKIAGMWLGGPSMDCGNGGSVYYIRIEKSAFRRGFEYFWFQVGIWAVAHAQHVEWTCWCAVKWNMSVCSKVEPTMPVIDADVAHPHRKEHFSERIRHSGHGRIWARRSGAMAVCYVYNIVSVYLYVLIYQYVCIYTRILHTCKHQNLVYTHTYLYTYRHIFMRIRTHAYIWLWRNCFVLYMYTKSI